MSTFPTDVLSVIVKALEPKSFTKFRATSKEYKRHVSDRFQYYQSQRIQELKELTYDLVADKCEKTKIIQSQAKRLEEQHAEYVKHIANSKAKTLLAFKRLQAINELKKKYELLLVEHNKLQDIIDTS